MTSWRTTTITGRHVLMALLAMFGVVILVNGVFAYFALTSHPGVVTEDSYVKGLRYNTTLDAAAAQRKLGWHSEVRFLPEGQRAGELELRISDAAGAPVRNLTVGAAIRRPVASGHDRTVELAQAGSGAYRARIVLPFSGNWDVTLIAERAGRKIFRLEHRLWLD